MAISPDRLKEVRMQLVEVMERRIDAELLEGSVIGSIHLDDILEDKGRSFYDPLCEVLIKKYTSEGWKRVQISISQEGIGFRASGPDPIILRYSMEEP